MDASTTAPDHQDAADPGTSNHPLQQPEALTSHSEHSQVPITSDFARNRPTTEGQPNQGRGGIELHTLQPPQPDGNRQRNNDISEQRDATVHNVEQPNAPQPQAQQQDTTTHNGAQPNAHPAPQPQVQQQDPTSYNEARPNAHPPPQPQVQHRQDHYHILRNWLWELFDIALAIVTLVIIFILNAVFNGHRLPDWGPTVNLSTLLSLLATAFQAAILACIAQIISQSRWTWFTSNTARPLSHLQEFDSASRGGWGAVTAIPTLARRNIVVFIAVSISLISSAIGPFVQQATGTTACSQPVPGITASLPAAHFVPSYNSTDDFALAFHSSIINPDGTENQIQPTCSTGNCTFPIGDPLEEDTNNRTYSSIGLCYSCINAISLVVEKVQFQQFSDFSTNQVSYTLPNSLGIYWGGSGGGIYLNVTTQHFGTDDDLTWASDILTEDFKINARWSFANISVLLFSGTICGGPEDGTIDPTECGEGSSPTISNVTAGVCIIYPCIKTYTASITTNKLSEELVTTTAVSPDFGPDGPDNASIQSQLLSEHPDTLPGYNSTDPANSTFYTFSSILYNTFYPYTGVKSPCLVDGTVYTSENMSKASNTTSLSLGDTDQSWHPIVKRISAPESCIYRYSATFTSDAYYQQAQSVFNSYCVIDDGGLGCGGVGSALMFGIDKWKLVVYNGGNSSFGFVDNWFRSHSMGITARYRTMFGSAIYNAGATTAEVLPAENITGLVSQTTVCTAVEWRWLLLPIVLLIITIVLLGWAVLDSWKARHTQPVWKDSLLPLIFYKDRFRPNPDKPDRQSPLGGSGASAESQEVLGDNGKLLEAGKMDKLAKKITVTFQLPHLEGVADTENGRVQGQARDARRLRMRRSRGATRD